VAPEKWGRGGPDKASKGGKNSPHRGENRVLRPGDKKKPRHLEFASQRPGGFLHLRGGRDALKGLLNSGQGPTLRRMGGRLTRQGTWGFFRRGGGDGTMVAFGGESVLAAGSGYSFGFTVGSLYGNKTTTAPLIPLFHPGAGQFTSDYPCLSRALAYLLGSCSGGFLFGAGLPGGGAGRGGGAQGPFARGGWHWARGRGWGAPKGARWHARWTTKGRARGAKISAGPGME